MVMTRVTINGVRLPVRGSIGYVMLWVRAALARHGRRDTA